MHISLANRTVQMANSGCSYVRKRLNLFTTSGGQVSRKLVFCVQYSVGVVETKMVLFTEIK